MELIDRVCIVTGASKGLGRAIALTMSEAGAKVAINGRNETDLAILAEEIQKKGREVFIAKADVSKSEEVNQMVDLVINHFGRVDVLVNNANTLSSPCSPLRLASFHCHRSLNRDDTPFTKILRAKDISMLRLLCSKHRSP